MHGKKEWSGSDWWDEADSRAEEYTDADRVAIVAASEEQDEWFAKLLDDNIPSDAPEAMDVAETARAFIDEWFYPLDHFGHLRLAHLYISDSAFTNHYENIRPGLARYVHDTIVANTSRYTIVIGTSTC